MVEAEDEAHERVGTTDGVIDGERVGEIVGDTLGPSDGLLFERQVHIGTRKLMNTKQYTIK